ncbi:MAG: RuvB-like domain-containing protein [Candidatus Aenigmatarchaeota archaeon]
MVEIQEISEGIGEFERIGSHSHIKGLGLKENGEAEEVSNGLVGQKKAREAAGNVVNLAKKGKLAGRAVLFAGPPGTGKTAIAVGIAEELGQDIPFVQLTGSEVFSADVDKTEILREKLRRALGVKIEETREVFEGKVANVDIQQGSTPMNPMAQIPVEASITLETEDETKNLRLGKQVAVQLQKSGIGEGDVVRIDSESGRVQSLGKCDEDWDNSADISVGDVVPKPKGDVRQEKDFTYTLTLHHIDKVNASRGSGGLMSIFGMGGQGINEDIRNAVDKQVKDWIDKGKGELIPGVLFIDEVHMLDIEAISFLNRAMEKEFAPIIVLASNRGKSKIRGTDIESPHGLPLDLLDRLLIINTKGYKSSEVKEIIKIRSREEDVKLTEDALEKLSKIGERSSMRYAVQLLAPASDIAELDDSDKIEKEHVEKAKEHFMDVGRSSNLLEKYEDEMLS